MDLLHLFKEYLFSQKNPPSKITVKNYTADIRKFISWYEGFSQRSFTPIAISYDTIKEFNQTYEKTLAAPSLERHISSLRKFFSFLQSAGYISASPFEEGKNAPKSVIDLWNVQQFKNYLYLTNASHLTVKNYLIDLKQFFIWLKEVSPGILTPSQINNTIVDEYKNRLYSQHLFSPLSINRKLSSIRKYINWSIEKGYIQNKATTTNIKLASNRQQLDQSYLERFNVNQQREGSKKQKIYSNIPPLRLAQKFYRLQELLVETMLVVPLAKMSLATIGFVTALNGSRIFQERPKNQSKNISETVAVNKIKNVPKALYAPLNIATTNFSPTKKAFHYLRHARPKWYKQYRSHAISIYFTIAILSIFIGATTFGLYTKFILEPKLKETALAAVPTAPPRILSFQGRLTDSSNNPITSRTDLRFGIYNDITASGSALLWQENLSVTPDTDGIFSTQLGNNTQIPSTLFSQNASLYIGVTVGQTPELTPRQQLATVAYAANAETLQGLTPITAAGAGTNNVVLALDSSGNLTIGGSANPTFQATGGQFKLSGQPLLLTTNSGSNGNIQLVPNGLGQIDVQRPLTNTTTNNNISSAASAVEIDDLLAVLATSSGQSAFTINQNGTGPLISASTSGVSKFTIDNNGNGYFAGNVGIGTTTPTAQLDVAGNASLSGNVTFRGSGAQQINLLNNSTLGIYNSVGGDTGITTSAPVLYVASNGNIGFGTNSLGSSGITLANGYGITPASTDTLALGTKNKEFQGVFSSVGHFLRGIEVGTNGLITGSNNNNVGTSPIASFSAQTSFASVVVDNDGVGDLFTASSSSIPVFTIKNNGTLVDSNYAGANAVLYAAPTTGNFTTATTTTGSQCLISGAGSSGMPSWGSCGGGANYWQQTTNNGNTVLSPATITNTLSLGVTGTGGNFLPYSSIYVEPAVNSKGNALVDINQTGNGSIFTASQAGTTKFIIDNAGNVGINTTSPTALLDVAGNASESGNLTFRGQGTAHQVNLLQNGTLGFYNSVGGDTGLGANPALFIANTGHIGIGTATANSLLTVNGVIRGTTTVALNNNGFFEDGGGTTYLQVNHNNNLILGSNSTNRIYLDNNGALGIDTGGANNLATLDLRSINGTQPTASISGATSFAGLVVDNSGSGDLFTASSSGLTRLRIANNGSVLFQGNTVASTGVLSNNSSVGSQTNSYAVANSLGDNQSMVPNAGFESTLTGFADGWVKSSTGSGSLAAIDTSNAAQGGTSVDITGTQANPQASIYSSCFPILGGVNYNGNIAVKRIVTGTGASPVTVQLILESYTSQSDCQTDGASRTYQIISTQVNPAATAFNNANGNTAASIPSGNTWARVEIYLKLVGATSNYTYAVDAVALNPTDNNGLDYAEEYPADPSNIPSAGDVVTLESLNGSATVKPDTIYQDQDLLGVVSTNPGEVLDDGSVLNPKVPIALAGRVPVKVSTKNGSIHIGDYLTSSDIPGVAVKATQAGEIIGTAMNDFSCPTLSNNIQSPVSPSSDCEGTVTVFIKVGYNNPNTINAPVTLSSLVNQDGLTEYNITDVNRNIITSIGNFSKAIIASVEVGFIKAQEAMITNLTVTTASVNVLTTQKIISPIADVDQLHTNIISPLSDNSNISVDMNNSTLTIHSRKDTSSSAVATIDNKGNEKLAGNLDVGNDATISGTLYAGRIHADQIDGLNAATESAQYITNITNIYQATSSASDNNNPVATNPSSSILPLPPSVPTSTNNDGTATPSADSLSSNLQSSNNYADIASFSAYLSYVPRLDTATFGATGPDISSQAPTTFSDVGVGGTLSVGSRLVLADNTINVLGADLELQPLKQGGVSIADGQVRIDNNGNLTVKGDATFMGNLAANIISPIADHDLTISLNNKNATASPNLVQPQLTIKNASDSGVFAINQLGDIIASGAATISKLNFNLVQSAMAVSDTEQIASSSAGTASITPYQKEVTIDNPLVTDKSLIYITPVGNPSTQIPYLLRQVPSQSFTVGISRFSPTSVLFNWLIIN